MWSARYDGLPALPVRKNGEKFEKKNENKNIHRKSGERARESDRRPLLHFAQYTLCITHTRAYTPSVSIQNVQSAIHNSHVPIFLFTIRVYTATNAHRKNTAGL